MNRATASIGKLQELNQYVRVNSLESLSLDDHSKYNVVVYTEIFVNIDKVIEANEFCRARNIGFLLSGNHGPAGFAFSDFGENHIISDPDGEETKSFIVVNATQANPVIVTVHEDKRHKFQDGDHVSFREIEGMTQLNSLPPTEIEVIDGYSFKVKVDGTGFSAYERQGLVENVKVPKKAAYHSLKQSLHNPVASSQYGMLETPDLRFFGRSEQLHLGFCALWEFQKVSGRKPANTEEDIAACVAHAKRINEENAKSEGLTVEELDEKVIANVARFAQFGISPMAAFFGGIVA